MPPEDLENASSEASDVELLAEGENEETSSEEAPPVSEEKQVDKPDEETSESEEEIEEPTEEESDEEEEETPEEEASEDEEITRPSWKLISEKYPELAKNKDFREMYHREKAYSEVFPTVADAKAAGNKAQLLEYFDDAIAQAKPEALFEHLKPEVLGKFSRNVLPALHAIDRGAFVEATKPFLIKILSDLNNSARGDSQADKNLRASVQNISKQLFGSFDLPRVINPDEDPEVQRRIQELERERENSLSGRERDFFAATDKSIKMQLTDVIMNGLDPEKKLTDYVKSSIVKQVLDETRSELKEDPAFMQTMKVLFQNARRAGYTNEFKPRFIRAYLGRAKVIALGLRAKHKVAAIGRRTAESKNRIENTRPNNNKTTQSSNRSSNNGNQSRRKSDMEILMEGAKD